MTFRNYLKTIAPNKGPSPLAIFKHWKVYKEWIQQIESKKEPFDFELPWITLLAHDYIAKYLKAKGKPKETVHIFEYGSGGSSLFFLKYGQVVSVEHDEEWFNKVRNYIESRQLKGWRGELIKPEPPDPSLMSPSTSNPYHYFSSDFKNFSFKRYSSFIDTFPDNTFDLVLVDGRSRPSCIYHSLSKVKPGGLLVLDNAEREYYLADNIIDPSKFELKLSSYGAVICSDAFSQTNIYLKAL
jgi:hypothetical protein